VLGSSFSFVVRPGRGRGAIGICRPDALSLLRAIEPHLDLSGTQQTLVSIAVENAFERTLLIEALTQTRGNGGCNRLATLVDQLVSEQRPDGSWASVPILRLTNRHCVDPAASTSAGPLFADPERLFTSATVVRALSGVAANDPRALLPAQPAHAHSRPRRGSRSDGVSLQAAEREAPGWRAGAESSPQNSSTGLRELPARARVSAGARPSPLLPPVTNAI
jgi:hypothetical protein